MVKNSITARQMALCFGLGMVFQYILSTHMYSRAIATMAMNGIDRRRTETLVREHQLEERHTLELNSTTSLVSSTPPQSSIPLEEMSFLRYKGTCGLGHRLMRHAAAYHAAHQLGFLLKVDWGGCQKNIFPELFDSETEADLAYVDSTGEAYFTINEVPGFVKADHNCVAEELESHYEFYSSLKQRFKQRKATEAFVQEHFAGHYAIGIHIRAGNGEKGDFMNKGRQIQVTPRNYTQRVSKHIVDLLSRSNNNALPPVLFVATDTAEYVDWFQKELEGIMPVVQWQSKHQEANGTGVWLGGAGGLPLEQCVAKWNDIVSDMILLASTDLLIAGQYSSFSQSMPMSLVLGRHKTNPRAIPKAGFCEVYQQGTNMTCYANQMDWCMQTTQRNELKILHRNAGGWAAFLSQMYASKGYQKKAGRM